MKDAGLYAATVLIWGASWIGILFQVEAAPASQALFYRFGLAGALILLALLSLGRGASVPRWAHPWCAAMGMALFAANYAMVYTAVSLGLTTALAAVVFSTLILMNALNTAIFWREPPGRGAILAAPLGLVGIGLLFAPEISALWAGDEGNLGLALLLCLGAVYGASLGNMISRRLQSRGVEVGAGNGWAMAYGAAGLGLWVWAEGAPLAFPMQAGFLISLALLVVFSTVIAFWAYLTLLGRIGADRAAYAFVAFPLVALALSSLFEDLVWTEARLAGVVMILAGNVALLAGRRPAVRGASAG